MKTPATQRLSKVLAQAGVAARRACEEIIFAGRVTVNDAVVLIPQTLVANKDRITVDGNLVEKKVNKVYFVLNKPAGYICSALKKSNQTKLVIDLFAEEKTRLFTVGRLDKDTQGLLLVTNDGHFAQSVIHPSAEIQKEYLAKTDQDISDLHLKAIANGTLVEGVFVRPLKVSKIRRGTLKITIGEGKKREVRLLLAAAGLKVLELTRIRIGGLQLGPLAPGAYRHLSESDKKSIFN